MVSARLTEQPGVGAKRRQNIDISACSYVRCVAPPPGDVSGRHYVYTEHQSVYHQLVSMFKGVTSYSEHYVNYGESRNRRRQRVHFRDTGR